MYIRLIYIYVNHKLYSKYTFFKKKIVFILSCLNQYCCAANDSDDTQTLINANDWVWLWRVNETVENIFIDREKTFCSFTLEFSLVFKYIKFVQEMETNLIINSNYDSLHYSIGPKLNKKLSLILFERMLKLFVKIRRENRSIKKKREV